MPSVESFAKSLLNTVRYFHFCSKLLSGYRLGMIYNRFEESGEDAYSLLLPLEKTFEKFSLNSTIVYKDSDAKGEYYGWENAAIIPLGKMTYIKAIANVANDENDDNEQGYHLGYYKMFNKHVMAGISGIHVDTEHQTTDSISASVHLVL